MFGGGGGGGGVCVCVLLQIRSRQGAAMLVRSLPMKSRKRLACDVSHTSATHAGHVYDVTDTQYCVHLKGQHPWSCFGDFESNVDV